MAVLPLVNKPLYLVIYQVKDVLGRYAFAALPETFEDWPEADEAAKVTAAINKKKAWVVGIDRPSLIELVAK